VEQGLLLVRHRDLLDRRRPVQLQVTIPHGRSNTRAATILIDRFLWGGNPIKTPRTSAN
jgi:hypothetical protein